MLKKFGLSALVGAALAFAPATALAADHDRGRRGGESRHEVQRRGFERHDFDRHDRDRDRGHWRGGYFYYGPSYVAPYSYGYAPYYYGNTYSGGYYDRWGIWHPYYDPYSPYPYRY